ncbi:HD domain-containing protein [Candidatus Pacearchaeota archaeon]|nr:HD domain-containing protein [Candidatus Pacearchaeota archaeon]
MIADDKVYGREQVEDPLLVELINSPELIRLKSISQYGLPPELYHKEGFSRYEHSVGVLILLRRLGADLKERAAGLVHDASHTAFSHVVDWVVGDPAREDYQDRTFLEFLKKSSLKGIFDRYSINYKEIGNLGNFSLLERELPELCADRFDYTVREMLGFESRDVIERIVGNVQNENGLMVFKSRGVAELFSAGFMECQEEHWGGDEAKARYHIFSEAIRLAIRRRYICFEDLMGTDMEVVAKLEASQDDSILASLGLLRGGFKIERAAENEGIFLLKKYRHIDPLVSVNGSLKNLSEISEEYARHLSFSKLENEKRKRVLIKPIN